MEKNKTIYVVEINFDKLVCETKDIAIKLFETLVGSKCREYKTLEYENKYAFVGKNIKVSLKAYVADLYSCAEEARVAKDNEKKLVKSGIMKEKKKKLKIKEVTK